MSYVSSIPQDSTDDNENNLLHQIRIDVERTRADEPLYQTRAVRRVCLCFCRFYRCSSEYFTVGRYVTLPADMYKACLSLLISLSGINDLATPFIQVFLSLDERKRILSLESDKDELLQHVEADTFWCLTKLLDGIQDNYTVAQPGIQRQIIKLSELVQRIDGSVLPKLTNSATSRSLASKWRGIYPIFL